MFCLLLRIGPIVTLQILLVVAGFTTLALQIFSDCYSYTFLQMGSQVFMVEIIVSLRMIKKQKSLRKKYLSEIVYGTQRNFVLRTLWNALNIFWVAILLSYWMLDEGLRVFESAPKSQQQMDPQYKNEVNSQQSNASNFLSSSLGKQAASEHFTMYPVCIFSELTNHQEPNGEFAMLIGFLYFSMVFINCLLITLLFREFYLYAASILRNRRNIAQNTHLSMESNSQSLLDCQFYDSLLLNKSEQSLNNSASQSAFANKLPIFMKFSEGSESMIAKVEGSERTRESQKKKCLINQISQKNSNLPLISDHLNQIECGICLKELGSHEKAVKLKCLHFFHLSCITSWLKVKDRCPYRCQ